MKKILAAAFALLLLCGCGGTRQEITPALSDKLLSSGAFEGSDMEQLDGDILRMLYGLEDGLVKECVGYLASNTSVSADELAIFLCVDGDAAEKVEQACRDRLESQLEVSRAYCPAAVPRLEKGIVKREGAGVVLAVGEPEKLAGIKELK